METIARILEDYQSTLKFLTSSFLLLLALFAILTAFNDNKLNQYKSVGGKSKYNWKNPINIFRFYKNQLKLNHKNRYVLSKYEVEVGEKNAFKLYGSYVSIRIGAKSECYIDNFVLNEIIR